MMGVLRVTSEDPSLGTPPLPAGVEELGAVWDDGGWVEEGWVEEGWDDGGWDDGGWDEDGWEEGRERMRGRELIMPGR